MEDRSSRHLRTLVTLTALRGLSVNDVAGALISMMVRSNDELQSETGYIDARPHQPDPNLLAPHSRTIHKGQFRPFGAVA